MILMIFKAISAEESAEMMF